MLAQLIIIPLVIIFLMFTSAFFSFSEIALASISKHKLTAKRGAAKPKDVRRIDRSIFLFDNYNEAASSIVVSNNIMNILVTTLATVWFSLLVVDVFGASPILAPILSFLIVTVIIIVLGEVIPKNLGKKYPERGILLFSGILKYNFYITKPITLFLGKLITQEKDEVLTNEDEFHQLLDETNNEIITPVEQHLIFGAMLLDKTEAKKRMVPFKEMIYIQERLTTKDKLDHLIVKHKLTRIPVLDANLQPIGIVNSKQYLIVRNRKKKFALSDYLYDASVFNENTLIHDVFASLRKNRQHMALLRNENTGKLTGLITIEDIIETIVGDIYDETDIEADGVYTISETSTLAKPNVKMGYLFGEYLKDVKFAPEIIDLSVKQFVDSLSKEKLKIDDYVVYKTMIIWIKEDKYSKGKIIYEFEMIK